MNQPSEPPGDPFEAAEGYEPCDPDSEPPRELADWIKEPVDQWLLQQDTVDRETYLKSRKIWAELGEPVLQEPDIPDGHDPLPDMQAKYVRLVDPATVKEFAEKLQPMVFEGVGLHMIPMGMLAQVENDPVILGQMFGVPRDAGYCPVLVLQTTIAGGVGRCLEQLHGIFHLLNDIYSDDPEEVQVVF